ncbi:MAG TPA: hypothetical protein VGR47_11675 [Terracidiphilus sp.]|nr:hypothetical protein [Terracidiphilus sp.]
MRQLTESFAMALGLPEVKVRPEEYVRLLGYPRGRILEGRALELANWAEEWYAANGKPWIYARQAESVEVSGDTICIDGVPFISKRLRQTLAQAEAQGVALVAVGAGREVEEEATKRWQEEKPDEYFFLEIFGAAVVEHLITLAGASLCEWAEQRGMAVLPHYSPGYPEWDVAEQPRLLELIKRDGKEPFPFELEVLDSGMLRPRKALLGVFGLTHRTDLLRSLADLIPCENCSFGPCRYRRAPYRRNSQPFGERVPPGSAQFNSDIRYNVNRKALQRWAKERLSLSTADDGSIDAVFRYDGTTCTNMGRPLTFLYTVRLGPRDQGYPVREQRCIPGPGDTGYTYMCQYQENPSRLMTAIEREKPLNGQLLEAVLDWQREPSGAGCFCTSTSRDHKWGLVLETIHFALNQLQPGKNTQS